MNRYLQLLSSAKKFLSRQILIDAFNIALFVGIILNLINNGPTYFYGEKISIYNVLLNFAIPFLVSAYSGTRVAYVSGGQH